MVTFHSEKLIEIRQFAVSRKQLILQVYTYLPTRCPCQVLLPWIHVKCPLGTNWESKWAFQWLQWWRSLGWYSLWALQQQRTSQASEHSWSEAPICPLKSLTNKAKLREGARWVVDQKRASPTAGVHRLLANALLRFVWFSFVLMLFLCFVVRRSSDPRFA